MCTLIPTVSRLIETNCKGSEVRLRHIHITGTILKLSSSYYSATKHGRTADTKPEADKACYLVKK